MFKKVFLLAVALAVFILPLNAQSVTQTLTVGTSAVNIVAATNGVTSIEIWQSGLPLVSYTVTSGPNPGTITAGSHYIWSQTSAYGSGTVVGTIAISSGIAQFTVFQSVAAGGSVGPIIPVPVIPILCPTGQSINTILATGIAGCAATGALGTINSGSGYALSAYGSAASTTLGPLNITSDSSRNNLIVPGNVTASGVLGWSIDTGLSRDSAGVIDFGNGTAKDVTGSAKLANLTASALISTVNLTASASVKAAFVAGNQGGALATVTLGAGWGAAASAAPCTTRTGYANKSCFIITSGSSTFGAAPTLTVTLPTALPSTVTVCELNVHAITGAGGAIIFDQTTLSTTAPVFTAYTSTGAAFTPAVTETYTVVLSCGP